MTDFRNRIRNSLDSLSGRMAEQLYTHFATFVLFLLIATGAFSWFLFRGSYQPLSFFHGMKNSPPVAGIVFSDGKVPDLDELIIVTLETTGRKISRDPEAVGAFFSVMDTGEGIPEFPRFLSPFVHGLPDWDGTPGQFADRADSLSSVFMDKEGSRLKGYFQIGQGTSPGEVRKFSRWARSVLSQKGETLVVIPPLVRLMYRDQVYMTGGILLTAGILLAFLILYFYTRCLAYSLPASFSAPMGIFWGLGLVTRIGFPLSMEFLTVIPLFFLFTVIASLRFWAFFTERRQSLEETPGPRERFRISVLPAIRGNFLFWLLLLLPALSLLFFGESILPFSLFILFGIFFTGFITALILPMSASRVPAETGGPKLSAPKGFSPVPVFLVAVMGFVPLFMEFMGIKLFPLRLPELADFMIWFQVNLRSAAAVDWPRLLRSAVAVAAGCGVSLLVGFPGTRKEIKSV